MIKKKKLQHQKYQNLSMYEEKKNKCLWTCEYKAQSFNSTLKTEVFLMVKNIK